MSPYLHEEVVQQAAAPEHRQPRDGADEVAGPERHHAQQEQRHLPLERVDVHGQEVRDRIPEQQAEEHHREGEPERRPQRLDEDAGLEVLPRLGVEEPFVGEVLVVVLERRVRRHPVAGGRPEAEHDDARERHHQEQDEPRHAGRDEPPDRKSALAAHLLRRFDDLLGSGRLDADEAPVPGLDGSFHSGDSDSDQRRDVRRHEDTMRCRPARHVAFGSVAAEPFIGERAPQAEHRAALRCLCPPTQHTNIRNP